MKRILTKLAVGVMVSSIPIIMLGSCYHFNKIREEGREIRMRLYEKVKTDTNFFVYFKIREPLRIRDLLIQEDDSRHINFSRNLGIVHGPFGAPIQNKRLLGRVSYQEARLYLSENRD